MRKANVLFIYFSYDSYLPNKMPANQISFGISYISQELKNRGYSVEIIVVNPYSSLKNIVKRVKRVSPEIIGFNPTASQYFYVKRIAERIKRELPKIPLLIGGAHASLCPDYVIDDCFDILCRGEGELAVAELVERVSKGREIAGIQNLWIKQNGKIEKNPCRVFESDLSVIPLADRQLWKHHINLNSEMHTILIGRGCVYCCPNCCNVSLSKVAPGKYVRTRTPQDVANEVEVIIESFPKTKSIFFETESFSCKKEYVASLTSELIARGLHEKIEFGTNLRVDSNVDYENLFSLLRQAGFSFLCFGLESGSERLRREILKRGYSNQLFEEVMGLARRNGFRVYLYTMLGIPTETPHEFQETIQLLKRVQPDDIFDSIFYPYPGTPLYDYCLKHGIVDTNKKMVRERYQSNLIQSQFSAKQIEKQFRCFYSSFYKEKYSLSYRAFIYVQRFSHQNRLLAFLFYHSRKVYHLAKSVLK